MTELHDEEDTSSGMNERQSKKPSSHTGKVLSVLVIMLSIPIFAHSQDWTVDADKAKKVSPFLFTDTTVRNGEQLFQRNCLSCHGEPTKANFNKELKPVPGDPAGVKFQQQSDGTIFTKMTMGRSPMPEFRNILSEDERWYIVSYIRSFNKSYTQPEPESAPAGIFAGMNIMISLDYQPSSYQIKVKATGLKDSQLEPVKGIEMSLWASRYFGNLMIDEPRTTNESGEVFFNYQDSIPGDSAGNLQFIVRLNADGLEGFKKDTVLKIGKPVLAKSLIDTRAMWTIRSHAPIWLMIAYSIVVIAIWTTLVYIVILIFRIKKVASKK
jgi:mono/diheme cytochrome c family protein